MTGIVERLRAWANEAADEIETLREALRKIEGGWVSDDIPESDAQGFIVALQDIARTALAKEQGAESRVRSERSEALPQAADSQGPPEPKASST